MPDHILHIPLSDRAEVLQSIAPRAGLPPHVLEKDIWVCWTLAAVFDMPGRLPLAFKGGTSLSKVYQAIGRFSEDIDLTIDYTALSGGVDPLTQEMSGTAIKKLSEQLRAAVGAHTREVIAPYLMRMGQEHLGTTLAIDVSDDGEGVRVRYPSAFGGDPSYLRGRDSVLLEFGGRNTRHASKADSVSFRTSPFESRWSVISRRWSAKVCSSSRPAHSPRSLRSFARLRRCSIEPSGTSPGCPSTCIRL